MNYRMISQLCLGIVLTGMASLSAEDWNQWRGPNRDGSLVDSVPLRDDFTGAALEPLWITEAIPSARGGGWSSPVVSGGNVYLFTHSKQVKEGVEIPKRQYPYLSPDKRVGMSKEEYEQYEVNRRDEGERIGSLYEYVESLHCIDAMTGVTKWTYDAPSVYTRFPQSGSPAIIDGKAYILGAGRYARCIDAESGELIWETKMPGEFRDEFLMSSFAVADGVAVVLCSRLFGLDTEDGEILWEGDEQKTKGTHTSPVVWEHNGQAYIIINVQGSDTACYLPKTGEELWRVKSEANLSTPIVVKDRLLTYGNSRKKGLRCYQLSPEGAEHLWTYNGLADKGSSPVVVGNFVYVQGERRLACVNLETGDDEWTTLLDLAKPQYTSLIAADNKVFYALDGLLIFEATPERFTPILQAKFNKKGLVASEDYFRESLGINDLGDSADDRKEALRIYENAVGKQGPLACSTPAISNGKIYIRLRDQLVCYDLSSPDLAQN
ncbi:Pyrrolo-quinoline quinone [Planctomycetales bacterium 10988]|nr:Pyrrolo-quinoline quinone [Planctomycetales bacterium 10988]